MTDRSWSEVQNILDSAGVQRRGAGAYPTQTVAQHDD